MSERATGEPPEDFQDLVRDALLHLYDLTHLQTHALLGAMGEGVGSHEVGPGARGRLLYRRLIEAIDALRPAAAVEPGSPASRGFRILQLRYVDGHEVGYISDLLGVSRNQYNRDHGRALKAVSSVLWDCWQLADHWPRAQDSPARLAPARAEAEHLISTEQASVIEPAEVLAAVGELLQPLCQQRGVELRVSASEAGLRIPGDRVALRQALLAVLSRALGPGAAGPIRAKVAGTAQAVEIQLAGPGVGRPDEAELGVAESRPFVEALGGTLTCRGGTRASGWEVCLRLPVRHRPTVLVVDNSVDFIGLVERYLVVRGWEVVGASEVEHALNLARELPLQAILLDVVIPGRDGWDLLTALKSGTATRGIPVVVCSVLSQPEVALSLGAVAYLRKPVTREELLAALSPLLPR